MNKEEISIVLTEAVNKELESIKDKIVKKLMKKTEKIFNKRENNDNKEKKSWKKRDSST